LHLFLNRNFIEHRKRNDITFASLLTQKIAQKTSTIKTRLLWGCGEKLHTDCPLITARGVFIFTKTRGQRGLLMIDFHISTFLFFMALVYLIDGPPRRPPSRCPSCGDTPPAGAFPTAHPAFGVLSIGLRSASMTTQSGAPRQGRTTGDGDVVGCVVV